MPMDKRQEPELDNKPIPLEGVDRKSRSNESKQRWQQQNAPAVSAYNEHVDQHGVFSVNAGLGVSAG